MAPVKKFVITMTSLTALALVMSACAGNLEAKKLGKRVGIQTKLTPAVASEDGSSSFKADCAPSDELSSRGESEKDITGAQLVDGKSNRYILLKNEVFVVEETKGKEALVISGLGEGEKASILCHNSKQGSDEIRITNENPHEIDSNDGTALKVRVTDFVAQNAKVGAKTSIEDSTRKGSQLLNLDELKQKGANLIVTKDDTGVIRIRYSDKQEAATKSRLFAQLTVYKAITAEEADTAKVQGEAQAQDEADVAEPKSAQEAADAVAREAGIPIPNTTPATTSNEATSTTQVTTTTQATAAGDEEELTEEERQAMQERINQRSAEISAEIQRRLAEKHAAEQEANAKATIAAYEEQQAKQVKASPCVQSSLDASCPNDNKLALARAAYQQQQAQAASTTTTTTTQPRSGRAADENDVMNGRGH